MSGFVDLALGDYDPNGCAFYSGDGVFGRVTFADWRAYFHGDPARKIGPDRLINPIVNLHVNDGNWDQVALFVLNHEILHHAVIAAAGEAATLALDLQIQAHQLQDWLGMACEGAFFWPDDYMDSWKVASW